MGFFRPSSDFKCVGTLHPGLPHPARSALGVSHSLDGLLPAHSASLASPLRVPFGLLPLMGFGAGATASRPARRRVLPRSAFRPRLLASSASRPPALRNRRSGALTPRVQWSILAEALARRRVRRLWLALACFDGRVVNSGARAEARASPVCGVPVAPWPKPRGLGWPRSGRPRQRYQLGCSSRSSCAAPRGRPFHPAAEAARFQLAFLGAPSQAVPTRVLEPKLARRPSSAHPSSPGRSRAVPGVHRRSALVNGHQLGCSDRSPRAAL